MAIERKTNTATRPHDHKATIEHISFGLRDERGREVGIVLSRYVEVYEAVPEGSYGYSVDPGTYFSGTAHATRNRQTYGAGQPHPLFHTEAERDAYLAQRVETTRKGYQRKYGKVQA